MIIVDTNVLSALMLATPDVAVEAWFDRQPRTSVWTTSVTIFEIRYGLAAMSSGRRRTSMQSIFQRVLDEDLEGRILPFDHQAAEAAAALMAERHRKGRIMELRDTMIAGIALAQRATLVTRNLRHFNDIGLPLVDPWT